MDITNIKGNVYDFRVFAKQYLYYNIEDNLINNTSRNPFITVFVNGFGYSEPRNDIDYDIFIKEIGLEFVDILTEEEKDGYSLKIVASSGNYFLSGKYARSKILTPILKVKGKNVSDLKNWECYWFVEDPSINIESEYYSTIGGLGWKCLNDKKNISTDATGRKTFQYVTNNYSLTITDEDVIHTLKYKCVLIQESISVIGNIILTNLNYNIETELFSATDSNVFIENTGYVNLIARIYYPTVTDNNNSIVNLSTEWKRFDKDGNLLDNNPNNSNIFYEIMRNNDPVEKISARGIVKKCYETEIKFPCAKVDQ